MLRSSAESAGMASIPRRDWNDVVVTHREYVRAYECICKVRFVQAEGDRF